jgi:hypothetical protein
METFLGGLAFVCLIAGQFLAVAVYNARWESGFNERHDASGDPRVRTSGSLAAELP